ncbi:MAG: YfhO family protein [Flavobacteriales bacterium]|nr:YfhO family protein [Flavobacteriales bacterium]
MNFSQSPMLKHLFAVLIIILVSAIYFYPELSGKKIISHDELSSIAAAKQMKDFDKKGETILWGNTLFSGMPLFQVAYQVKANVLRYFFETNKIFPKTMWLWIMLVVGFYVSLAILGFDSVNSLIGSIAFGLSTWFMLSIEAGHATKILTIAFIPPMISSILISYRGKWLIGGILTSLFLCFALMANHPQIVYYSLFFILVIVIAQLIDAIKEKRIPVFFKRSIILLAFGILGVLPNTTLLWTTYDYSTETIRGGKSELTKNVVQSTGLDMDYAMQWSYGKAETLNLLVPGLYAGGAVLDEKSETYNDLIDKGVPKAQIKEYLKNIPLYYGEQPFTTGPSYIGAALIFLFVLLFFISSNRLKWILLATTVLSIVFAWGNHFLVVNEIFFTHFPLFNKFRVPSMWLSLTMITVATGAVMSLNQIFNREIDKEKLKKGIIYTTSALGGLVLLLMLFGPSMISFDGQHDAQLEKSGLNIDLLISDRSSILTSDSIRTLFLIIVTAAILWVVNTEKLKNLTTAKILLALVIVGDLWMVDKRFVNENDFIKTKTTEHALKPTAADSQILSDKEPNYRVFNTTVSSFNDNNTSYFHQSVGGYSAAKLIRYQDLIENQLSKGNMNVFNMLNTKYFITGQAGQEMVNQNTGALGSVWFIKNIDWAANADEEMKKLTDFNPSSTVVIDARFKEYIGTFHADTTSRGTISLTNFHPDNMVYQSNSSVEEFAVFSEIWYKGNVDWKAYIDGKETEFIRVNYLLRGLKIPAGNHKIEFKFYPESHYLGSKITLATSIAIILLIGGLLVMIILKKQLPGMKED